MHSKKSPSPTRWRRFLLYLSYFSEARYAAFCSAICFWQMVYSMPHVPLAMASSISFCCSVQGLGRRFTRLVVRGGRGNAVIFLDCIADRGNIQVRNHRLNFSNTVSRDGHILHRDGIAALIEFVASSTARVGNTAQNLPALPRCRRIFPCVFHKSGL